ncbi:aspartate/glutamate racemase family protein [Nodosilinea sp. E11]|uniref:aspartate/glutamate racemase family protein n=1 Tax=Nodosilinea sp. E11 TaxID=3037479 RepID=UPI002934B920|nr:aspartate/glutamate racemase family protein [Nodosilinea sp. E11]WOD40303.1 aspartate/glutamate racemase family protein [Nodosilinea sp. E11]
MKISVINPNTTATMTEKIGVAARQVAAPTTEILACNPTMGPVSIEGHYDEALSVIGVLDEIRRGEAAGMDGYVIACFGDPGLGAARELARGPVIGIAEAAMHVASLVAPRFSIVTTLGRTKGIAQHLVTSYGMTAHCAGIRAAEVAVLALEESGSTAYDQILQECRLALVEDEAEAIVLGCGGMADLAAELAANLGVPVIEGVTAGVKLVEAVVALGLGTSKVRDYAYPIAKPCLGLLDKFALPS